MKRLPLNTVLVGDARRYLERLPSGSVDCVITSPPYFQLRNYGSKGQIGLEGHVTGWVRALTGIFRETARVLKPTGSLWLNLGDSYSRRVEHGAPPKSLLLGPERLALELLDQGWVIRNKVIWAKTNPMPASVRDRLTCTWEVLYFMTRRRQYHLDLDAIRIPHRSTRRPRQGPKRAATGKPDWAGPLAGDNSGLKSLQDRGIPGHPLGKNPGDVWTLPTASFHGAHFATFPRRFVERPLLATCPAKVCTGCGKPWGRQPHRELGSVAIKGKLRPTCRCESSARPGVVLDPFMGAGTVAVVAAEHGRDWVGIELNPDFAALTNERLSEESSRAA